MYLNTNNIILILSSMCKIVVNHMEICRKFLFYKMYSNMYNHKPWEAGTEIYGYGNIIYTKL